MGVAPVDSTTVDEPLPNRRTRNKSDIEPSGEGIPAGSLLFITCILLGAS